MSAELEAYLASTGHPRPKHSCSCGCKTRSKTRKKKKRKHKHKKQRKVEERATRRSSKSRAQHARRHHQPGAKSTRKVSKQSTRRTSKTSKVRGRQRATQGKENSSCDARYTLPAAKVVHHFYASPHVDVHEHVAGERRSERVDSSRHVWRSSEMALEQDELTRTPKPRRRPPPGPVRVADQLDELLSSQTYAAPPQRHVDDEVLVSDTDDGAFSDDSVTDDSVLDSPLPFRRGMRRIDNPGLSSEWKQLMSMYREGLTLVQEEEEEEVVVAVDVLDELLVDAPLPRTPRTPSPRTPSPPPARARARPVTPPSAIRHPLPSQKRTPARSRATSTTGLPTPQRPARSTSTTGLLAPQRPTRSTATSMSDVPMPLPRASPKPTPSYSSSTSDAQTPAIPLVVPDLVKQRLARFGEDDTLSHRTYYELPSGLSRGLPEDADSLNPAEELYLSRLQSGDSVSDSDDEEALYLRLSGLSSLSSSTSLGDPFLAKLERLEASSSAT